MSIIMRIIEYLEPIYGLNNDELTTYIYNFFIFEKYKEFEPIVRLTNENFKTIPNSNIYWKI